MRIYSRLLKLYTSSIYGVVYFYLRWKLCPFEEMEKYVPKSGAILDAGCGEGVFANYLALCSDKRKVVGVDLNFRKVKLANKTVKDRKNIEFIRKNIFDVDFSKFDGVVMSDFLHHISYNMQDALLKKCYGGFKKGDVLLIKEVDRSFSWRYFLTWMADKLLYPFDRYYPNSKKELVDKLRRLGFKVEIKRINMIVSTVLFICEK